jgi:acetyl-CoA synthetase
VFKKSNHPLFVLFTSGSTGDPKGIIHSTGGYFVFTKLTCKKQFGMNNNSVVLTASDAGWINGHTYALFGPLSFGATTVILEKPLSLLNENLIKDVLHELKVNILYLPVTIIRILKSIYKNRQFIKNNLIAIGSMGEPLAKDVAKWFSYSFSNSNLPIVNTYFQTETGGIISSPKYNSKNIKKTFGTVGRTTTSYIELNINFNKKILNKKKKFLKEITIKTPWPGCMIGIVNGTKMFNKYWNNSRDFKLFDVGFLNKDKFLEIVGRSDDVINIRGHRVGSGEIESELIKISGISEVCAIGSKDELEGNRLVIFFSKTNKKRKQNFTKNINKLLSNIFGNYLLPKHIIELSSLPKTKSGKILRRVLKNLIENPNSNQIGDTSTILDSQIIVEARNKILNKLDF